MSEATAVMTLDVPELASLPPSKAEQIRAVFVPMADMLADFEADYAEIMTEAADEVTPALSYRARRLRLDIAKVRIEAEKARVALKQEYLLAGRAIDGTNNILKWAISQKEEALESVEKHAEIMEAERRERLQADRTKALTPYVEDAGDRDLGGMEDDVWEAYLAAKKQAHEDRLEAERRAAEERAEEERIRALTLKRMDEAGPVWDFIEKPDDRRLGAYPDDEYAAMLASAKDAKVAHEAEQARIEEERARLAKEAEKKEKARKRELARIEKEREEERAKIEAERKKEREAAEAERKKREALEAAEKERQAKEEAERKAREKAEQEAAKAPVKARLGAWVDSFELPPLPGDDHAVAATIRERFAAFHEWARAGVDGI